MFRSLFEGYVYGLSSLLHSKMFEVIIEFVIFNRYVENIIQRM